MDRPPLTPSPWGVLVALLMAVVLVMISAAIGFAMAMTEMTDRDIRPTTQCPAQEKTAMDTIKRCVWCGQQGHYSHLCTLPIPAGDRPAVLPPKVVAGSPTKCWVTPVKPVRKA